MLQHIRRTIECTYYYPLYPLLLQLVKLKSGKNIITLVSLLGEDVMGSYVTLDIILYYCETNCHRQELFKDFDNFTSPTSPASACECCDICGS